MDYFKTFMWILLLLASAFPGRGRGHLYNEEGVEKLLSVLLVNGIYTGHMLPLVSIGEELVRRGHRVTLVANILNGSHTYPAVSERVGVNFVSSGFDKYFTKDSLDEFHKQLHYGNITMQEVIARLYEVTFSAIQVKNKVEDLSADQFDVIVCDVGIMMVGVYFHMLGKKVVIFNPVLFSFEKVDLQWPTPLTLTGQSDDLSFFDRAFNTLYFKNVLHFGLSTIFERIVEADEGYSNVLQYRGGLEFIYYHGICMPMILPASFGFEYPKAHLPLKQYVGPVLFNSPPDLSSDLKQWLDEKSHHTVIYISMGTTATLPASTAKAIRDGIFLYTSYSAVWVMKEKDQVVLQELFANLRPDQLYLADWVSQQSLLRHRALAIFISHCGTNSVYESIYNGHPVICIPSVYDQFDSAVRVVSAGVGVSLYSRIDALLGNTFITSQMVIDAINRVSEGNYCSHNISRLRRSFQLAGGARRAADLIEFYEDVGYDHLVPAFVKYQWSWVQYYNCDVWATLAVTMTLLLSLFLKAIMYCV